MSLNSARYQKPENEQKKKEEPGKTETTEMPCNGLSLSGSESRFFSSAMTPKPEFHTRISFPKSITNPTRVTIGSSKARAATMDEAIVTEAADMAQMSFYDLLGIPESGSLGEIKQAYKQLARKYHPDVSPPDRVEEYTKRFIRVQEAYETLSDPSRRALYDRDMSMGLHLAFSARRRYQNDEGRGQWRTNWQDQVSELKRRSMNKDSRGNMSWGARMRRQRAETPDEL